MNIEQQYIQHTISIMAERMAHVQKMIKVFRTDKAQEQDRYGAGILQGYIQAYEEELAFLERQITFLRGSLR